MTGDDSTGVTLVLRDVSGPTNRIIDPTDVRSLVNRVIVMRSGRGRDLCALLDKVFPGVDIDSCVLAEDADADGWTRQFRRMLGPDDCWLLLLDDGCNASIAPRFQVPAEPVPYHVLHYAGGSGRGFWAPILLSGTPSSIHVDRTGRIGVVAPEYRVAVSSDFAVRLPDSWTNGGTASADALEGALDAYRRGGDPNAALDIARCHDLAGRGAQALFWYRRCLALGPDDAELRWTACYRIARALHDAGRPWPQVERVYLDAFDIDPDRAEPLFHLARHYRDEDMLERAFDLARLALDIDMPVTRHCFEWSVYNHELALLLMACAADLRRDRECIEIANNVLRRPRVPETARLDAARLRSGCLARLQPPRPATARAPNRIVVISPFRNGGEFVKACVDSLSRQDYRDARFVLIDDASTDGALDALTIDDPRFIIVRNNERRGGFSNQILALERYCEADDVAVYLDGDDRLLGDDVLGYVNDCFNASGCWLMYGQYRESGGRYGRCEPVVGDHEHVIDAIRDMHFPMHIRAHRAGLFHRLKEIDPHLDYLRGDDGEFLEAITDMALMRALMQLAGLANIHYNDRVVYEYNTHNPDSHFREHKQLQERQARALDAKPPLAPIASYRGG